MIQLTKDQRNKVYKLALHIYTNEECELYICFCIDIAFQRLYRKLWNKFYVQTHMIEFIQLKPEGKGMFYPWWPEEDRQSRIDCLNKCIELTNKEVKK